jgi:hypothetical protein
VSRTNKRIQSLLTLALLAAALSAAHGQDAPATPPAPAASDQSAAPAAQPDTQQGSGTKSAPAAKSGAAGQSGKTPAVCFELTMHCVDGVPPAGAKNGTATKGGGEQQPPLNLKAPDVRTVVSPEELQEPLPSSEQQAQAEEGDTVQVKSEPNAPDVPGGFGAIWWAMNHPSQAWRILAPAQ